MLFDLEEPRRLTKEEEKREARERLREKYDNLGREIHDYLCEPQQLERLRAFRERVARLFEAMHDQEEPCKRRPNVSLRLVCSDEPAAKVITLPQMRSIHSQRYLVAGQHQIELLEEREVTTADGVVAKKFTQALMFPNPITPWTNYRLTGLDDARRVMRTIGDFLDNPATVLARSHDHCCICGRGLVDGLSCGRGIGPECIKRVDMFLFITDRPLVQPEQSANGERSESQGALSFGDC